MENSSLSWCFCYRSDIAALKVVSISVVKNQLMLKTCVISSFLTFESMITIMIKFIQNLSNKPELAL